MILAVKYALLLLLLLLVVKAGKTVSDWSDTTTSHPCSISH